MAQPNGGLITETNQQYYAGAQGFTVSDPAGQSDFTFTFDTSLVFGDYDPANVDYAKNIRENEEVIKKNNIVFIIDPSASLFLIGCTIDWKQEKFKNGFTFENPNELARCGCGESFSVS